MTRDILRAALCLWAATIALGLLFLIRGCAQGGLQVKIGPIEFVER